MASCVYLECGMCYLECGLCLHSYASDEIHFNLMAIVSDRKRLFEKQITEAEQRKELAAKKVIECFYN